MRLKQNNLENKLMVYLILLHKQIHLHFSCVRTKNIKDFVQKKY